MTVIQNQQPVPFTIPDGMEDFVETLRANGLSDEDIKTTLADSAPPPETGGPQPAEEDGEDSNILGNIGAGILQGIDKGTKNILSGIPLPDLGIQTDDGQRLDNMADLAKYLDEVTGTKELLSDFSLPEIDQGSITGNVTKGVSQALVGIIPATKFLKAMGVANRFVRGVVGGAIGDFATSSEEEAENLLKAIDMIPQEYGGEIADSFVDEIKNWIVDPSSGEFDELKSRLLNTAPGIVIGVALEGVIKVAVAAKNAGPEAISGFVDTISTRLRGTSDKVEFGDDGFDKGFSEIDKAGSKINSQISFDGGRVNNRSTLSDLYTQGVDRLNPLKKVVDDLSKGKELPAAANPYKLARLNVASASKANLFLENEVRSFKTGEVVGRSLKEVLKPIASNPKKVEEFANYATSRRALELMQRTDNIDPPAIAKGVRVKAVDRENFGQVVSVKGNSAKVKFLNKETGAQVVTELPIKSLTTYSDEFVETGLSRVDVETYVKGKTNEFGQMFDDVVEYQDNVLQYLVDSGVVNKTMQTAMKEANKDYIPFFRVMDDDIPVGSMAGLRNPIKKIKGSEKQIQNPLESIIKNTYLYVQMADRNEVLRTLYNMSGKVGDRLSVVRKVKTPNKAIKVQNVELQKVFQKYSEELGVKMSDEELTIFRPQMQDKGSNTVDVFIDGKRKTMEMEKEVADVIAKMDDTSVNIFARLLKYPATTLRAGAILDPEFFMKNIIRDNVTAGVFSKNGYKPFIHFFKSVPSALAKNDKAYKDWVYGGGAQATLTSLDRTYLRENLKQITEGGGFYSAAKNIVRSPLDILRLVTETAENATRIAEFRLAQKSLEESGVTGKAAMQEAAFQAREITLDFARMGAQARGLNQVAAFFNARVQGYDRLARAFMEDPVKATKLSMGMITTPSVLLWYRNHGDPRYEELPQWQKDMFWIVLLEDEIIRVPKPFELGIVFGTIPEHILTNMAKSETLGNLTEKIFGSLKQDILGSAIPTIATPMIEQGYNVSFFRGRPLIPQSKQGLLDEDQFSIHTNEISKTIAKMLGAVTPDDSTFDSPIVVENYIRQWTGGLGKKALDLAEFGLKKAGVYEDRIKASEGLKGILFVSGFVIRYPSTNLQSIEDFYKKANKAEKVANSLDERKNRFDMDGVQALLEEEGLVASDGIQQTIRNFKKTISEHRKLINLIDINPDMNPDEKREHIDTLLFGMLGTAQQGEKILDDFNKAQKKWKDIKPTK